MKTKTILRIFPLTLLVLLLSCSKQENNDLLFGLSENEFIVKPQEPSSADEVLVITYDCKYNQVAYINKDGVNIELIKHFNSMMKQACVLDYDTISLGKLDAGTYQIKFIIVDTSTTKLESDSIFNIETQQLEVVN